MIKYLCSSKVGVAFWQQHWVSGTRELILEKESKPLEKLLTNTPRIQLG